MRNVIYDMAFFKKYNENHNLVRSQSLYDISTDINYLIVGDDSASENDQNSMENNTDSNEQNVPEQRPQQNLMAINRVPFGARGRKRRHSLFVTNTERDTALDHHEQATIDPIEPMGINPEVLENSSNDASNNGEWLIDFSEPQPQPQPPVEWNPISTVSNNFNQIMDELEDIDFTRPDMLPKGTTAQMIAYRANQGIDIDVNINNLIDNADFDFGDLPHFESN